MKNMKLMMLSILVALCGYNAHVNATRYTPSPQQIQQRIHAALLRYYNEKDLSRKYVTFNDYIARLQKMQFDNPHKFARRIAKIAEKTGKNPEHIKRVISIMPVVETSAQ